jgi:hypothetical protein
MDINDAADKFKHFSDLLDNGLSILRSVAIEYAEAENAYRKLIAEVWLQAPPGDVRKGGMSADERLAWVQARTADARQKRDIADGMRLAALESVRSRRAQLSALQSLLAADRAEAEFAARGPRLEP